MSKKLTLLSTCLIVGSAILAQQENPTSNTLDEVVVTANKVEQKQAQTGKVVTVITKATLEQSGGKDLPQLLNEQTGININGANSNSAKDKTLYLRGAGPNYTIILLDGVPLIDPSSLYAAYDLRMLPISQIARIEIVKGSQSTLYGSNAIAGVINIITKKYTTQTSAASFLAAYGSYNTQKGNANFAGKKNIVTYDLNYQYNSSDGIAEAKDTLSNGNFPKNGFQQHAVQAKLGIDVTKKLQLSPFYRFAEYKGSAATDAFQGGNYPYQSSLVNTGLTGHYTYNKGTINANYGYDLTSRTVASAFDNSVYQGKFQHAETYITHRFNAMATLVAGGNYQSFHLADSIKQNTLTSAYASLLLQPISGLHIELGSRYNYHNHYGNNVTYSISPAYIMRNTVKVFGSISSGFRAPSVDEMFGKYSPNPNLQPEKSTNIEGGLQVWLLGKKLAISSTYFNRKVTNAIAYTYVIYVNRDKQNDEGVETEIDFQANKQIHLKAAYTYTTGKTTIDGKTNSGLLRRPKSAFNLFGSYQITKQLYVNSTVQIIGDRTDAYFPPPNYSQTLVALKAYALWNVYASYKVDKSGTSFFVDAKNLTNNTNYYEAYGYSVQGCNIMAGISFKL